MDAKSIVTMHFTPRMYHDVWFSAGKIKIHAPTEYVFCEKGELVRVFATPPFSKREEDFLCEVEEVCFWGSINDYELTLKIAETAL